MKNKSTKHALLASVLSIVMCFAMLISSTFAWFTDEVKSGVNKIVAGNLNVELYHSNGNVAEEKVDEGTNLFVDKNGNAILWEPGAMVYENFTVKNEGTLALKYKLTMNVSNFNTIKDTGKSLKDVLKVAVIEGAFKDDRTAAQALTFDKTLADFVKEGELAADDAGKAGKTYAIVIYWEPSDTDNDYNLNNGKESSDGEPLFIDLGVNLTATQASSEKDSFGDDYDSSTVWLGGVDTTWYDESKDTFTIDSPDKFAGFAKLVNDKTDFAGKSITLNCDVDLADIEWTPIGSKEDKIYFTGTFDGNNKTISGLNIASGDYVSLFGAIKDATVKNLTVKGSVNGENGAGIVARMESGTIENCVSYVNVSSSGKAGGIVCLTNNGGCIISGCENYGTVDGAGTETVGGVGGIVAYANPNTTISDCKNFGDIGSAADTRSGGIVGYGCTAGSSISNCVNSGNIIASQNAGGIVGITTGAWDVTACTNNGAISCGVYAGGIAGSVQNGKVENCKNTASVSGKTAGGVIGVTGGAPEVVNCSGGTATITTPAQQLGFNGHTLVLDLAENACAGRLIGANGGGGPEAWVKLTLDDTNGDDTSIRAIGICGPYTTWSNLEVVSGTFYGDPVAGNTTYIKIDEGVSWANREPGTYYCGGVTESTRKTEWTKQ